MPARRSAIDDAMLSRPVRGFLSHARPEFDPRDVQSIIQKLRFSLISDSASYTVAVVWAHNYVLCYLLAKVLRSIFVPHVALLNIMV